MYDLTTETVKAVNIALAAFCTLEAVIVLLNTPQIIRKTRTSRVFYIEMLAVAFTTTSFTISLVADWGHEGVFSIVLRALAYIGIYIIFYVYIIYLNERINAADPDHPTSRNIYYASLVIAVIGAFLWILALFDPDFSGLDRSASLASPSFWVGNAGGFVLVVISMVVLISNRGKLGIRQTIILSSLPIFLLVAVFLESLIAQGVELRCPALALGFVIIYTQHHMEIETKFEKEEAENMHNRMSMATGRMKPHYLYNVLTSIYYLCETDPQKAQYAIGTFSEYLRNTLEAMEKRELVSFSWELSEIRNYLTLERLRFGDRIKVDYDIEYEDFMIPPLSIQPLVENAVKHGLAPKEEGGTVKIVTRKLHDGGVQIRIIDDGVGFNIDQLKTKELTREGVANVRERIRHEVGGDMTITSKVGGGTTSTVTIKPDSRAPGA